MCNGSIYQISEVLIHQINQRNWLEGLNIGMVSICIVAQFLAQLLSVAFVMPGN